MDTEEIDAAMRYDKKCREMYVGTFPIDKTPKVISENQLLVVNLDSSEKPGSHWVLLVGEKHVDGWASLLYFDSYGRAPPKEIQEKYRNYKITYADLRLQSLISQVCGYHVICVAILIARGYSLLEILLQFYRGDERYYLRNDYFASIISSSLCNVQTANVINWDLFVG